ncbi:MAG: L-threonylcarbamoyladenylate synthase [Thermodesulfobacteriota bacterium]
MNTRVIKVNPFDPEVELIEEAAQVLRRGGVIGYPTETVYGLGVDAYNEETLQRLYKIKVREQSKPISLLVGNLRMLEEVASRIPPLAMSLIQGYWPGALTIIFEASKMCHPILTAKSGKVGVRISPHLIAQKLLEALKRPITSTSANLSGMPSLSDPLEVYRVFRGKIDLIIDGGKTEGEGESTVIDVTVSPPVVLREGTVRLKDGISSPKSKG